MDNGVIVAIASAFVVPALGVAAAWGSLGARLRALEGLPAKVDGLGSQLTELGGRFNNSAESQGKRIGKAQSDVDRLAGQFEGFERGFYRGARRTKTAAHGNPEGGKDE